MEIGTLLLNQDDINDQVPGVIQKRERGQKLPATQQCVNLEHNLPPRGQDLIPLLQSQNSAETALTELDRRRELLFYF